MPMSAPKPCSDSGCPALVRDGSGRCEAHKRKKETGFTRQLSRHERGYGYAWEKLRLVVLRRDAGLCVPCQQKGRLVVATIVDHTKPKAEGGTDDMDNLQAICRPCHVKKTAFESARGGGAVALLPDWLPKASVPVCVVAGPPGSGKTTYVRERAQVADLVLDVDELAAELTGKPIYHASREEMMAAIRVRNKLLAGLADADHGYLQAWLIVTAGSPKDRAFWLEKYGEPVHLMNTPKPLCIERIKADARRPDACKRMGIEAVLSWS